MIAPPSPFTLADCFERAARADGARTAVVDEDRALSFAQLDRECDAVAALLARRGVGAGDRVAFLGHNGAGLLVALGACAKLGAVFVPLHMRLSADEVAFMLDDSGARALFLDPSVADDVSEAVARVSGVRELLAPPDGSAAADGAGTDGDRAVAAPRHTAATGDDLALIMYTAATEGRPRGAMIPHRAIVAQNLSLALVLGLGPDDRFGAFTPLSHTAALSCALAFLHVGAGVVVARRFDAPAAARTIARERVTATLGFPPMAVALLEAAEREGADLSSLRIRLGFDAPEVIERCLRSLPGLRWMVGNYGQTETHGMAVLGGLVGHDEHVARSLAPPPGREMPLTRVRVVDPDGREAAPGEPGELVVRGPTTAAGYWRDPEATREALREGWWHTGDLGTIDAEGGIRFLGPAPRKELIKTGGENVYPREVETVLRRHPSVRECAVVGVPDARWGQSVKAYVVAQAPDVTAAALIEHCREHLTRYKKPRFVEFVEQLPRTAAGDVDRARLRQNGA